jgi:hypothetical protein
MDHFVKQLRQEHPEVLEKQRRMSGWWGINPHSSTITPGCNSRTFSLSMSQAQIVLCRGFLPTITLRKGCKSGERNKAIKIQICVHGPSESTSLPLPTKCYYYLLFASKVFRFQSAKKRSRFIPLDSTFICDAAHVDCLMSTCLRSFIFIDYEYEQWKQRSLSRWVRKQISKSSSKTYGEAFT